MDDFSEWIIEQMEERGMSQSQLARASGLSKQTISDYVNRKRTQPDERALQSLARGLQLPVETVYEKAGILTESPPETEQQRQLVYLYNQLPEDEQKRLVEYAGFLKAQHDKNS